MKGEINKISLYETDFGMFKVPNNIMEQSIKLIEHLGGDRDWLNDSRTKGSRYLYGQMHRIGEKSFLKSLNNNICV